MLVLLLLLRIMMFAGATTTPPGRVLGCSFGCDLLPGSSIAACVVSLGAMAASIECCSAAQTGQTHIAIREFREDVKLQLSSQKELLQELSYQAKHFHGELAAIRHFLAKNCKREFRVKAAKLDGRGAGFQGVGEAPLTKPLACDSFFPSALEECFCSFCLAQASS